MKTYIMIIDPFVMSQQIYECVDGQLKIAATFELTKIESYNSVFELFNKVKDEEIELHLRCPKAFKDKIKEKIYTYIDKKNYNKNNLIIRDI